jgi:hypothetical protein
VRSTTVSPCVTQVLRPFRTKALPDPRGRGLEPVEIRTGLGLGDGNGGDAEDDRGAEAAEREAQRGREIQTGAVEDHDAGKSAPVRYVPNWMRMVR